jgi:hypothetical protein
MISLVTHLSINKGNIEELNLHIEESDECQPDLSIFIVVVDSVESMLNGTESNDLLEEVEVGITRRCVREEGDGSRAGPGDDADEEDTEEDSTSDAVHHQQHRHESTQEDTNPDRGALKDVRQAVVRMFRVSVYGDE